MNAAPAGTIPAKFTVGQVVTATSICDHNAVWSWTVVSRTAKFVTLVDVDGKTIRAGVKVYDGAELAYPLGRYSMAPTIRANR